MVSIFFNHKLVQDYIVEEARSRIKDYLEPKVFAEIMERAGRVAADKGDVEALVPFMALWGTVAEGNPSQQLLNSGEIITPKQIVAEYANLGSEEDAG